MITVRSALFSAWLGFISAVMTIGCIPLLVAGPHRTIIWAMRQWARLVLGGARIIVGVRYEVRGEANIPRGPGLIASKHQSMWETVAFHILLADPAIVMKRELMKIPLYGQYAARAGMIAVDREGHARTLRNLVADARARLANGRQIVIFPEGTRRVPGALPDYMPGIAALYGQLGVPCVPVALNSGHFWPRAGIMKRPGTIVIEFLQPLPPGLKRADFMAALEGRIEAGVAQLVPAPAKSINSTD